MRSTRLKSGTSQLAIPQRRRDTGGLHPRKAANGNLYRRPNWRALWQALARLCQASCRVWVICAQHSLIIGQGLLIELDCFAVPADPTVGDR